MLQDTPKKSKYAVITADVLYDKRLTPRQKLLVATISNLSNEKGYCWASNKYFSEIMGCNERSIQRDLTVLDTLGILGRVIQLDQNGQFKMRVLTINDYADIPTNQTNKINHTTNMSDGGDKFDTRGYDTNVVHNNKDIKNKDINNRYILVENENFEQFWNMYDRKEGKQAAMREWDKLTQNEQALVLEHAKKYVAARAKLYRAKPEKYLREKMFYDDIVQEDKPELIPDGSVRKHPSYRLFEQKIKENPIMVYGMISSSSQCKELFEMHGLTYDFIYHKSKFHDNLRK